MQAVFMNQVGYGLFSGLNGNGVCRRLGIDIIRDDTNYFFKYLILYLSFLYRKCRCPEYRY
jgi:hypothetical protein